MVDVRIKWFGAMTVWDGSTMKVRKANSAP